MILSGNDQEFIKSIRFKVTELDALYMLYGYVKLNLLNDVKKRWNFDETIEVKNGSKGLEKYT